MSNVKQEEMKLEKTKKVDKVIFQIQEIFTLVIILCVVTLFFFALREGNASLAYAWGFGIVATLMLLFKQRVHHISSGKYRELLDQMGEVCQSAINTADEIKNKAQELLEENKKEVDARIRAEAETQTLSDCYASLLDTIEKQKSRSYHYRPQVRQEVKQEEKPQELIPDVKDAKTVQKPVNKNASRIGTVYGIKGSRSFTSGVMTTLKNAFEEGKTREEACKLAGVSVPGLQYQLQKDPGLYDRLSIKKWKPARKNK